MAEARSALIVATCAYKDEGLTRLKAPGADAEALSEVLADPEIGGFDVRTVINQPSHVVNLEVANFFANRKPDELLLLHFSCHGVKDDSGELYFASSDTRLDLLEATAVSSAFVNKVMGRSRSSRVVLLLDCCYAGAFARGMVSRGGSGLDLNERLGGRGRAVITASTALQFAFDGTDLAEGDVDREEPSVFTRALVSGLRSGEADRDQDGMVALDELYGYVYDEVTAATPHQTPGKWVFGLEGDLFLARRSTPVSTPSELPKEIVESVESAVPWHRAAVISELERLLQRPHPGRALAARLTLQRLAEDDSRQVAGQAAAVLAAYPPAQRTSGETRASVSVPAPPALPPPVVHPAVHPQRRPDAAARARPDAVPMARPDAVPTPRPEAVEAPRQATRPGAAPGPGGATVDEPPTTALPAVTSSGPPGWWPPSRRTATVGGAGLVLLLATVALLAWWLVPDRTPAGSGGTAATLADSTVLVTDFVDGRTRVVAVDASTGERISDFPVVTGRLPSISPDRRWIIYAAGERATADPRNRELELHRMRADGSDDRRWLSGGATCPFASRPTWDPNDPDQLAVTCLDKDQRELGIWRVDADGTLGRPIVQDDRVRGDPTWTGDHSIVYARSESASSDHTILWEVATEGEDPTPTRMGGRADSAAYPDWSDHHPDWSPSGLLFTRSTDPEEPQGPGVVYVRSTDGLLERQDVGSSVWDAAWSPDGQAAVWRVRNEDASSTIWTGDDPAHPTSGITGRLGAPAWGSR